MGDEIIEFKPGIGPLKLNFVALCRRILKGNKKTPVTIVADRFLQIFQDHGILPTQIPRVIPDLTLDKLATAETLLPALNGKVLDAAADLFGIRRNWLEGVDEQIYEPQWAYKAPERLFEKMAKLVRGNVRSSIVALCSDTFLNYRSTHHQPIVLVLREQAHHSPDLEIERYHIFNDGMRWEYFKCRIQLKAMARVIDKVLKDRIPMHVVKANVLKQIESGRLVPRSALQTQELLDVSLEDYALFPEESLQSKEAEELPEVLDYIKAYDLECVARSALNIRG